MNFRTVLRFLGLLAASVSMGLFFPLVYSQLFSTHDGMLYIRSMGAGLLLGLALYALGREKKPGTVGTKEAFACVTFSWLIASLIGALPYWFSGTLSFPDAYFESISGFTCTGGSTITHLNRLTESLLLWRSLTQWIGGMGIILLALAFVSSSDGGLQLYRAELSSPYQKKLTPRIQDTAMLLWGAYLIFTLLETAMLYCAGMGPFDAFNHALTTVSTGGFSTRNTGIGYFDSRAVEWIILLFMFLSGVNFTLYCRAMMGKSLRFFKKNEEFIFYIRIIALCTLGIALILALSDDGRSFPLLFRHALFQVVSTISTTGYFTEDYTLWPIAAQYTLFILMFSGSCALSAGGGVTNIRILIILRHTFGEFRRLLHPRAIIPVRIGNKNLPARVVSSCFAFLGTYIAIWCLSVLFITSQGIDLTMALSTAAAMLGNIGPALGAVGPSGTYATHPQNVKWCYCILMLCGRLGIYTPLLMLSPRFWKT